MAFEERAPMPADPPKTPTTPIAAEVAVGFGVLGVVGGWMVASADDEPLEAA